MEVLFEIMRANNLGWINVGMEDPDNDGDFNHVYTRSLVTRFSPIWLKTEHNTEPDLGVNPPHICTFLDNGYKHGTGLADTPCRAPRWTQPRPHICQWF